MNWPQVLDEDTTLDWVAGGVSIARFGDGEFNLCLGNNCITQPHSKELAKALRKILIDPGSCLVGIPRIDIGPKFRFWDHFNRPEVLQLFGQKKYASAFITRPDSAPWIDRANYWDKIRKLWSGKNVTLVRGSDKSLTADMLNDAKFVTEIVAPKTDAFRHYKYLLEQIGTPEVALLCLGPTATVIAHELSCKGVHAVDLGHVGMFLRKHIHRQPMVVTEQDRAVDRV